MWVRSLGWEDPLEEGMATHSSILAWRIPMEPGRLHSCPGVTKSCTRLKQHAHVHTPNIDILMSFMFWLIFNII